MNILGLGSLLYYLGMKEGKLIPTRWQTLVEELYEAIQGIVKEQIGDQGRVYFPLLLTLFIFIVGCNLIGLIPYSFTVTTHLVLVFTLSLMVFVGVTILGFLHHRWRFFKILIPSGSS